MYLAELIETLESYNPETVVKEGFNSPHSYRGYYDELAFEPARNVTIGEMLAAAKEADGATYQGYKGGEFTMGGFTNTHIANYGDCGDALSARLLRYMLADVVEA